jgi:ubiquinone/menaquinone biosynthesis C-methylase UbiE
MVKSATDLHWQARASAVEGDRFVNIQDVYQRDLELEFICPHLRKNHHALEVGCGNGYSTSVFRQHVGTLDAFDYSESMVERAIRTVGETNNRFFHDNLLAPQKAQGPYDTVICVRVLINLRNFDEQVTAIHNMKKWVKPGGQLILVEGYLDGFKSLDKLRHQLGLPSLEPAKINYYCWLKDILPLLEKSFTINHEYHLGNYDYLTRVVYAHLVGQENVSHNTQIHKKLQELATILNPDEFKDLSRIRGFVLKRQ